MQLEPSNQRQHTYADEVVLQKVTNKAKEDGIGDCWCKSSKLRENSLVVQIVDIFSAYLRGEHERIVRRMNLEGV